MERKKAGYLISTDLNSIDLPRVHQFLTHSYWARGIPIETVSRSIEHSLCFGIYAAPPGVVEDEKCDQRTQVGFSRVVSDQATFAYLADVYVEPSYRGQGLARWLMECITQLLTSKVSGDSAWGRVMPTASTENWLEIRHPDPYSGLAKA